MPEGDRDGESERPGWSESTQLSRGRGGHHGLARCPRLRAVEEPAHGRHLHLRQDDRSPQPRAKPRAGALPPSSRSPLLQPARGMERGGQARSLARSVLDHERGLDPKLGSGGRGYLSAIEQIDVVDKHTVRIITKQPSASLLAGMAGNWSSIVPREIPDLRRTAVGTGPFILQEWVPQSHIKARKNPDYWDKGKPYVDAVEVKVIPDEGNIIAQLRTGNIHHALLEDNKNYLLVKDDKRLIALRSPRLGFDMVNVNHGRKPYTDVRVRQALALAVDRNEVLQAAAAGLGSITGPLTPAMKPWALPVETFKDWYTPNPERAKKLLAEAGYPSGFKTTLKVIPTFPTMVAGAQVIAAQLKKIGVDAQIIQEEYGVWIKAITKPTFDFDLTMNITNGDADPDSLLYRRFHSVEKQWNNDGDPEIDTLLDQGKLTMDQAKRKDVYDKVQRLMIDKAIQVWTFAPDMIDVTQNYVHYAQHFTTNYYGFRTVWLER